MLRIQTILHPTDFSPTADQALQIAHSLARDHKARLILVNVAPEPPLPLANKYQYLDARKNYESALEEDQRSITSRAAAINAIPVETCFKCGDPGPAILETAEKHDADLIVMGTHGRTGVSRLLMGSIAEHVLRHATCPVLSIRPGTSQHLSHDVETSIAGSASS